MSSGIQILDLTVIGPFVRNIKSGTDWASIWIDTATFEKVRVENFVEVIYGIVKSEENNLWNLLDGQVSLKV